METHRAIGSIQRKHHVKVSARLSNALEVILCMKYASVYMMRSILSAAANSIQNMNKSYGSDFEMKKKNIHT